MLSDLTVIGTGSLLMGDDGVGVRIIEQIACSTAALGCEIGSPPSRSRPPQAGEVSDRPSRQAGTTDTAEGLGSCATPSVEYLDGSVGGLRLLNWIEQANRLLFVDAARFGGPPGRCRLLTLEEVLLHPGGKEAQFSLHETDLVGVLRMARQFYRVPPTWLLAIQVESVEPGNGLSAALSADLPRLTETVRRLAQRLARKP